MNCFYCNDDDLAYIDIMGLPLCCYDMNFICLKCGIMTDNDFYKRSIFGGVYCSNYCYIHSLYKYYDCNGCGLCNSSDNAHYCHIPIKNRYMNINIL